MTDIESKAAEIERLCEHLHKCVGKSSLYKEARDTVRKIEKLSGEIRRGIHIAVQACGGM